MTNKQLLKYVSAFRRGILSGAASDLMCFAVCAPLQPLLQMDGVECELTSGMVGDMEHYWIELADGRIIDPTADQFSENMPEVYIGARPENYIPAALATPPEE